MMDLRPTKPKPGDSVVLIEAPPGLLYGLPREDQKAISEIVGKPIRLVGTTTREELSLSSQTVME